MSPPDDAQPAGLPTPFNVASWTRCRRPGDATRSQEELGASCRRLPRSDAPQEAHLRQHRAGHHLRPVLGHHLLHHAAGLPVRAGLQQGKWTK